LLKRDSSRAGFSLMEIVVAVSIIVILGAVLTPAVLKQIHRSKVATVCEDFNAIKTGMLQYYVDVGTMKPLNNIGGFTAVGSGWTVKHFITGDGEQGWDGPYLERVKTKSPFGGTYDVDIIDHDKATIDLGVKSELGSRFQMILEDVDAALDDDGNTSKGTIWGDSNGIHMGVNYFKK